MPLWWKHTKVLIANNSNYNVCNPKLKHKTYEVLNTTQNHKTSINDKNALKIAPCSLTLHYNCHHHMLPAKHEIRGSE